MLSKAEALKICLITDTWFPIIGGGPQVVWNYAKLLSAKYNCKIDIITRRFNQQDNPIYKKRANLRIIQFNSKGQWNSLFSRLIFIVQTFLFLLHNNYDLMHAFPFISGLPVFIAGFLKKIPVVFSVFAISSQYKGYQGFSFKINNLLENFFTQLLPYKLLITDNQLFFKKYKKKNIVYIPNGVDINLFESIKVKKSRIPQLLFVGRFHKQKGLDCLIKSIDYLKKKIRTFKLLLIGWGPEEDIIRMLIQSYGLQSYIKLRSPVYGKALISEYKRSQMLILPSLYEGQGIVVFEAWAAKIPVITTKVGSLKYLIKNGINGFLVNPDKPRQLADTIYKLLKNNKRSQMGINGFNLVEKEYTWEKAVSRLYKEYLKLL